MQARWLPTNGRGDQLGAVGAATKSHMDETRTPIPFHHICERLASGIQEPRKQTFLNLVNVRSEADS